MREASNCGPPQRIVVMVLADLGGLRVPGQSGVLVAADAIMLST